MEADATQYLLGRLETIREQLKRREGSWPFNPCLPGHRIALLEEHHQIALPEDYRLFLQQIGNGGAGLFSLEDALHIRWEWVRVDYFNTPFVPPISPEDAKAHEEGWGPGLLTLEHTGCGECIYLVVSGSEYGHIWQGQISCPLPAFTLQALPQQFRPPNWQGRNNYLLSPAHRERLTFLSWYERFHLPRLLTDRAQ